MSLIITEKNDVSQIRWSATFNWEWISPTFDWTSPSWMSNWSWYIFERIGRFCSFWFVMEFDTPGIGNTTLSFPFPYDSIAWFVPSLESFFTLWYVIKWVDLLAYYDKEIKPVIGNVWIHKDWSTFTIEWEFDSTNVVFLQARFVFISSNI